MSTRASIAVKFSNNYGIVYCHHDGDHAWVGRTLLTHYNDQARATDLLKGGDMSSLGRHCTQPPDRNHVDWAKEYTEYYGRDYGETGTDPFYTDSYPEALSKYGQFYNYLWADGCWWEGGNVLTRAQCGLIPQVTPRPWHRHRHYAQRINKKWAKRYAVQLG